MTVVIDNPIPQKARNGRKYFSFWARFIFGTEYLSVSGFKYFPDTKAVSTPTAGKGDGKFVNLSKMSTGVYNAIQEAAERTLGAIRLDDVEPAA